MFPRATENTVVGHMRPAGLQLDHTDLINKSGTKTIYCQIMAMKFVNKNVWLSTK